ncbi:metallophosphoesterase family protein [Azospirillum sp. sgz302134]
MFGFARRLWSDSEPASASVPRGVRVYAVGDIHGRLDLLEQLLGQIERDAASAADLVKYIVFLGDYVDRGPQSRMVIDRLAGYPPPGFGAIHLRGNHEAAMLEFLEDARSGADWIAYGGGATIASYGIVPPAEDAPVERLAEIQHQLLAALPHHHRAFLTGLRASIAIGDYLFVHAGIRPGVPLDRQSESDLLWIRREFLTSHADHGKVVVHGHTIADQPEIRANRIGIDTGAFATNRLTALVLEGTDRRFLCTI